MGIYLFVTLACVKFHHIGILGERLALPRPWLLEQIRAT